MTITPYLKKRNSSDNYGIINLRITKNRKSEYHSLKINIKEKLWNDNRKEVRKTDEVDYISINEKIKDEIEKLKKQQKIDEPDLLGKKNVSFIQYFRNYLEELTSLEKLGTYKKYNTTIQHLTEFIKKDGKTDLKFSDVDYLLIENFDKYLQKLHLKSNTRNGYLKCCQKLFNLSIKEKVFRTYENPFVEFNFKRDPVEKRRLSFGQVQNLIGTEVEFGSLTYETRIKFLIQIYGQGLRISDSFTIRYKNIDFDSWNSRIIFFQFKTKKRHSIQLSIDLLKHIFYFVNKDLFHEMYFTRKYSFNWKDKEYKFTFPHLEKELERIRTISLKEGTDSWEKFGNIVYQIIGSIYEEQLKVIKDFSFSNPNKFVIPWLNESYFKKVEFNDNTILSKQQYNHLQSRITVYNRNLKRLEKLTGTNIRITSHTPRHTYTNLLLSINTDVYSISKSLGHSNLSITENYLNDFERVKVDGDNTELFRMMNLSKTILPKIENEK
jgi:site-specific recombinase XerD